MTHTARLNGAALLVALAAAALGALAGRPPPRTAVIQPSESVTRLRRVPLEGGGQGVADASGSVVPLRPYRRIVSTNLLSDRLLVDLAEPHRVVAYSTGVRDSPWPWLFSDKPTVDGFGPVEALVALKPDLVLMNVYGTDPRIEKLREAGIEVFNLGQVRGLATLVPLAQTIAALLGDEERGLAYGRTFLGRMRRVALPLGDRPRRRALFLSVVGGNVFGGTRGTSYHDVLVHAGLEDVAAQRYRDWPQYRPEEIAALDPEVVVTSESGARAVCGHPALEQLRACRPPGAVLTLPGTLLADPGPAMLDAAEQLFAKAYPDLAAGDGGISPLRKATTGAGQSRTTIPSAAR